MEAANSKKQFVTEVRIPTGGQQSLLATYYGPDESAGRVIVINPATGVRQEFYRHIAAYFARHGFHVYTYDYRGIGRSRPKSLRTLDVDMLQWGEADLAATTNP